MVRPKGNAPAREKVEHIHLTKSGLARQHIQELILSGAVREGQHITAREVCEAVGISETPVREAIRGLAAEGWLELNAHHGVVVATLRAEELYAHADYHAFNAGRARRIARMTSFLARNGLHHIYEPGESGASFDARMATLHLPPAVRPHSSLTTRLASLRSWLGGQTRQSGEGDPLTLR